ncbi:MULTISPECIES: MHYT domain-containing protein [Micromonospora]|uniref:Signal protein n=1 Tax=Micromonospora chalcea TaxID=1874 RepID=A0ABX9Y234_MICCH|nr:MULTISPECIES: MHYT domain-containing protein [Micromonospora]MBC8993391.1 signal protein [Micromonospora chalcea]MBQ1062331.1 signal protein [Micromonospora sp. C41]NHO80979.1 signal protein [Micromonospora sp. CMU55-4]ODB73916.1 signal protein [Micromonospora sp. II]RQW91641.1 signal protein [Micromonospora chalcea]
MGEINHFEYGWITPALSYALSVLGSALGLVCAGRIRTATSGGQRAWWGLLAAWALGGTAIWAMHFMAMLGFAVSGTRIRYDVPLTAASTAIAVASVGIGLAIVGTGRLAAPRLLAGGFFTGAGVAAMHYTGMAAMRLDGSFGYDPLRVTLSVVIAIVAATVALWLAMTVRRGLAIAASALVMGIAVNGMHFTGMSALSVHLHESRGPASGTEVSGLLVPIVLAVVFGVVGLVYALLAAPSDDDRAGAAYVSSRLGDAPRTVAAEPAPDPVGLRARSTLAQPGAQFPSRRSTDRPS